VLTVEQQQERKIKALIRRSMDIFILLSRLPQEADVGVMLEKYVACIINEDLLEEFGRKAADSRQPSALKLDLCQSSMLKQ